VTTAPSTAVTIQSLRHVPLFSALSDDDLSALAEHVRLQHFEAGQLLIKQGDPADALYIIQSGRAEVVVTSRRSEERVIDSIGPGEPAGELALLTGGSRTASVRAVEPVEALALRRDEFIAVMDSRDFSQRIAVVLADRLSTRTRAHALQDPTLSRFLFADTRLAGFWLVLRVWLGYEWLQGALPKLSNPGWMVTGQALQKSWQTAVAVTGPFPQITYPWYRAFIEFLLNGGHYVWFAKLIALGEMAVGLGLVFGCLTGAAAAGGLLMNASYLLAGSASINPVLAALEVPVILAWKVAGWWGLDRWVLSPWLQPTMRRRFSTIRARLTSAVSPPGAVAEP